MQMRKRSLPGSAEMLRIIDKVYFYASLWTYGETVDTMTFSAAVRCYRAVMGLIYSPGGRRRHALGSLEHITLSAPSGTFNIAADGVITLTQAIRRAGRIELPVPSGLVTPITGVFADVRSARLRSSQMDYLTYGRVLDNTRMRTRLGFEPRFTTSETLEDFIERGASDMVVSPNRWRELEQRIVSTAHQLL